MINYSFSENCKKAFEIAESLCKEFSNEQVSPSHLLKAILNRSLPLRKKLELIGTDVYYVDTWADFRIQKIQKTSKFISNPQFDMKSILVMDEAENIRLQFNLKEIDLGCILSSLCIPGVGYSFEQLKTLPIIQEEVNNNIITQQESADKKTISKPTSKKSGKQNISSENPLEIFCKNLTEIEKEGKIDPVVGRDREIQLVVEALSRRSKPNAILVGEPGVGKTAIVDGLTQKINADDVTSKLQKAIIYELDLGALIAGASYKGEVEDRLKKIIGEIKQLEKAILFIDEIHLLLDKHGGAAGASNLLKPELARGELTIIGATTQDEFAKYVEGDEAFTRRFEIIRVEEPDDNLTLQMLQVVIPKYVEHHGIQIDDESLKDAIKLAKRFSKDRKLPDSAIDLIDRSMAAIHIMNETGKTQIENLRKSFLELQSEESEEKLELYKRFYFNINKNLSYLLLAKVKYPDGELIFNDETVIIQKINDFFNLLEKELVNENNVLKSENLSAVIAFKTGIPIGKLQSSEQERLLNIEEELNRRVIGQDHAIKEIAQAIRRSRAGIRKQNKPVGSFFLVGPTGTGKTELARTLADYLFQDENAMIRFDMSEFTEEASVSLLHGASPGYVGYEEGGLLVNEIRQNPYSVVLFDEIEKAHQGVFKIFFQILDEGKLTDKLGKEGDFTNSIILFTSNIGSEPIIEAYEKEKELLSESVIKDQMKSYFPPALINRLDKIIPFAPIHEEVISLIFNIHIKKVEKMLESKRIKLIVTDNAKMKLSSLGYNIEYGARPLLGVIRDYIETPLANMLIAGELNDGNIAKVDLNKEDQFIWEIESH